VTEHQGDCSGGNETILGGKRAKLLTCSGGNETEGKFPIHCSIYRYKDNRSQNRKRHKHKVGDSQNNESGSGAFPSHNTEFQDSRNND
jgi:hypothetical protein